MKVDSSGLTVDVMLKGLYVSPKLLHWLSAPMRLLAMSSETSDVCREGIKYSVCICVGFFSRRFLCYNVYTSMDNECIHYTLTVQWECASFCLQIKGAGHIAIQCNVSLDSALFVRKRIQCMSAIKINCFLLPLS